MSEFREILNDPIPITADLNPQQIRPHSARARLTSAMKKSPTRCRECLCLSVCPAVSVVHRFQAVE